MFELLTLIPPLSCPSSSLYLLPHVLWSFPLYLLFNVITPSFCTSSPSPSSFLSSFAFCLLPYLLHHILFLPLLPPGSCPSISLFSSSSFTISLPLSSSVPFSSYSCHLFSCLPPSLPLSYLSPFFWPPLSTLSICLIPPLFFPFVESYLHAVPPSPCFPLLSFVISFSCSFSTPLFYSFPSLQPSPPFLLLRTLLPSSPI